MCQYSCEARDGVPGEWQLVHLASRAVGGAGLIVVEASGVRPEGRITPWCTGIWNEAQQQAWAKIVKACQAHGAKMVMQLAHAGRKGSTFRDWSGVGSVPLDQGGWQTVSATSQAFGDYAAPRELMSEELPELVSAFANAASRAVSAGFDAVEIHAAHGYLIHQFLSPLSNHRSDSYGGSLENRARLLLDIVAAIRKVIPSSMPLMLRLSATDYQAGGWDEEQTAQVAGWAAAAGVDFLDVSSGGLITGVKIPSGPGYQVPFAEFLADRLPIPVSAVGQITTAEQAEEILQRGKVQAIFIARASLRDPYFPLRAAHELGQDVLWPSQYLRGKWPSA